jgi:glycosidase
VFYQIFPDRFYDGNPANNVKTAEYSYCGGEVVAEGTPKDVVKIKGSFTGQYLKALLK